jgi:hypothetical protein
MTLERAITDGTRGTHLGPAPLLVCAVLLSACSSATAADPQVLAPTPPAVVERIVAVGDLHGDLDNALRALELGGVVDRAGSWIGGTTTLVQTGDLTDRGPDSRALIDLMRRLDVEATAAGGRVVSLLGNHEVMNIMGDWRYVHPGDLDAFGGADARRAALSPSGEYGAWLMDRHIVADVGDAVFVHGGLRPEHARRGLDALNTEARRELMNRSWTATSVVVSPTGPLWDRDYVLAPESEVCPRLAEVLASTGKARMVVGHTTRMDGRILTRCGGRLHVLDIGISDAYGGHIGAWVWESGDARAVYPGETVDLEDPS